VIGVARERESGAVSRSVFGAPDAAVLVALLLFTAAPMWSALFSAGESLGTMARVSWNRELINRGAMAAGQLPLWNPYEFGGRPHFADPDTLVLYPPHLLLKWLPVAVFFRVSFILHTWLAGAGTYLTGRHLKVSRVVAAAAAVAMCSGVLMPSPGIVYSPGFYPLAWLPLIVMLALRSADRPTWRPYPGLVVVVALALLASGRMPIIVLAVIVASYAIAALWSVGRDRTLVRFAAQPAVLACLVTGLTAFQIAPAVRFWASMRGDNDTVADTPSRGSWHLQGEPAVPSATPITNALRELRPRGRVLSVCNHALDAGQFVAHGLPGVGGYGGRFLANYGRFSTLVRGPREPIRASFDGIPEAVQPARPDLLSLLGAEYLVACERPDAQYWEPVREGREGGVYRNLASAPRAFWTCAPVPVGREEIQYRLRHGRYDRNFVLHPEVVVHVRWAPEISAGDRARLEPEFHLVPRRDLGDRTWQYLLLDLSSDNITAILRHPAVEDTQHIDRATAVLAASATATPTSDASISESLIGGTPCGALVPADVRVQDRFDGGMSVDVQAPQDGIVFFSETYYPDRRAWVDGHRVARVRVNLAFTGVPVSAGARHIELRYDMRAVWIGVGVSAVTLVLWMVTLRRPHADRV
jgi:hypothetical protein